MQWSVDTLHSSLTRLRVSAVYGSVRVGSTWLSGYIGQQQQQLVSSILTTDQLLPLTTELADVERTHAVVHSRTVAR